MKKILMGITPIALLTVVVILFVTSGNSVPFTGTILTGERPAIEELSIQKVRLERDLIRVSVYNDGPDVVDIRQVLVNGGFWAFEIEPSNSISRMKSATIEIEYPWNVGDDQHIVLVTSTGTTFNLTIPAAVESPNLDWRFGGALAVIGFFIGVVPVLLGLLWFPFIRSLSSQWYNFFMALTIGLLIFLGVDSLHEALEIVPDAPKSLNGIGVVLIGFALSFLSLFYLSRGRQDPGAIDADAKRRQFIALTAAIGIGIHNLGEGLVVGSAFALGNISLGATLIIGFMIHNLTEGLPIAAPLAKEKAKLGQLIVPGLIAGAPAIIGTWVGGYAYSPIWSVFFLGIGAGAIFQVAIEIALFVSAGSSRKLFSFHVVTGLVVGLTIMYATGLVISA